MSDHSGRFKPGHKLGKGRPPKDFELAQIMKINKQLVDERLSRYMFMTRERLLEVEKNPQTPAMDIMIISLINKGIKVGDPMILNFLLDRTIGKVKESVEVDMTLQAMQRAHDEMIEKIPRERLIDLVRLKSGNAGE